MKITWDATVLADDILGLHASQIRIGWRQVNQEVHFLRAAAATFFQRGHRGFVISFTVKRGFATVREAEQFCFTHFPALATKATLICRAGAIGETGQDIEMPDSVIEGADPVPFGRSLSIAYQFRCSQVVIPGVGDSLVTEGGDRLVTEAGDPLKTEAFL